MRGRTRLNLQRDHTEIDLSTELKIGFMFMLFGPVHNAVRSDRTLCNLIVHDASNHFNLHISSTPINQYRAYNLHHTSIFQWFQWFQSPFFSHPSMFLLKHTIPPIPNRVPCLALLCYSCTTHTPYHPSAHLPKRSLSSCIMLQHIKPYTISLCRSVTG